MINLPINCRQTLAIIDNYGVFMILILTKLQIRPILKWFRVLYSLRTCESNSEDIKKEILVKDCVRYFWGATLLFYESTHWDVITHASSISRISLNHKLIFCNNYVQNSYKYSYTFTSTPLVYIATLAQASWTSVLWLLTHFYFNCLVVLSLVF